MFLIQLIELSMQVMLEYPYWIIYYPIRELPHPGINILVSGRTGINILTCYFIARNRWYQSNG